MRETVYFLIFFWRGGWGRASSFSCCQWDKVEGLDGCNLHCTVTECFITFALLLFSFYTVCTLQLIVLGSRTINFTINSVFLVDHIAWILFHLLMWSVSSHVDSTQNCPYLEEVLCSYSGVCPVFQVDHPLLFSQTALARPQLLLAFRNYTIIFLHGEWR